MTTTVNPPPQDHTDLLAVTPLLDHDTAPIQQLVAERKWRDLAPRERIGAVYDYGPLGVELKQNVKSAWWSEMVHRRDDVEGVDAGILMHPDVPDMFWVGSDGGELLVTVGKDGGMGGRNQEFAVSAAVEIEGCRHVIVGAVDSDGTDGPGHQFVEGRDEVPVLAGGIVDGREGALETLGVRHVPGVLDHGSALEGTPGVIRVIVASPGSGISVSTR